MTKKEALNQLYRQPLKQGAPPYSAYERFVPGEGNPDAPLLLIGEAPGAKESELGRPFVGASGTLLRKLLQKAGFDEEDYFITNIVKRRPPKNRTPLPDELAYCFNQYLEKEIDILKPALIATLGASSLKGMLPDAQKISCIHGTICSYKGIPLVPLYHPAYAIYQRETLQTLFDDIVKLRSIV